MQNISRITRRQFLSTTFVAGSAAALAACKAKPKPTATAVAPKLDLPFQISPDAIDPLKMPEPVAAEGVFFSGGYGHAYIQYGADLFAKVHPGSTMSVEPIQGVGEKLRPRFVGGDPPDVIDNSGAGNMDYGALVFRRPATRPGPVVGR